MTIGAYEFLFCPPEGGRVRWERRWETGFARTGEGQEERESKRAVGLKTLRYTAQPITIEERAQLLAGIKICFESRAGRVCAPFWGRSSVLAADVAVGTGTIVLESNVWGFDQFDYVFLFDQEARLWEIRSVTAVVGATLTLDGNVARTYRAGTLVWPVIFGELSVENAKVMTNHHANPAIKISENSATKVETNPPAFTEYLGRPVAPFGNETYPLEAQQRQEFSFDLRKLSLGFGASSFQPLQNTVVNGWDLDAILDGVDQIHYWDCFTNALQGRGAGFWLSDVNALADITSAPAADKVRVVDSDLASVWAADPAVYVIFRKYGSADQIAKINAVADIGGGIEEITLDAALALDDSWIPYRLRYVRLADDIERADGEVENRQRRELRVIELPEEYAAVETGRAPVWLYTFWIETPGGNTYWRLTSFATNVTSNGDVFTAGNINHGNIKRSVGSEAEEVAIEGERATMPFSFFAPLVLPLNLWVKIEEATTGDLDTTEVLFQGLAVRAAFNGRKASLKCASFLDALGAEMPNFTLQHRCNYRVFGPGCLLARATYQVNVVIRSISADRRTIEVSGAGLTGNNAAGFAKYQNNYWALGWLEFGAGATFQVATILKSDAVQVNGADGARLYLSLPLQASAVVTSAAIATPGCDGNKETCFDKFNNYTQYGGQPFIPKNNPNLPATYPGSETSAKK